MVASAGGWTFESLTIGSVDDENVLLWSWAPFCVEGGATPALGSTAFHRTSIWIPPTLPCLMFDQSRSTIGLLRSVGLPTEQRLALAYRRYAATDPSGGVVFTREFVQLNQ